MLGHKLCALRVMGLAGVVAVCNVGCGSQSGAESEPQALAEGFGLAASYPGDVGIESDPAVLLADDFEQGSIEDLGARWEEVGNQEGKVLAYSEDVPPGSGGQRSLQMTATLAENTGGHLYQRLPRGVDKVFVRFYVKFPADGGYIHHFVHLGGYNPPTPWPQGHAGERPQGSDRVTVGIEPTGVDGEHRAPGVWNFYCYWHEMKISADDKYWGNSLRPVVDALVPRDRWQCVEVMLKLNSAPEEADGELALWLDGKLQAHFLKGAQRGPWTGLGFKLTEDGGEPFEGFRWRASDELKINFFNLSHYVTEGAARANRDENPSPTNRVWFDDVVVSTEYIGPIKE